MKKALFFFISVFLFFCITISASASDYLFLWQNTIVEVPLFGNISQYLQYPTATLYYNGGIVENTSLSYLRTGSGLYLLDDVDTSIVGKYQVLYKVYDYTLQTGNCDGYSQLITFDVKDLEAPVISISKEEISLPYSATSYDYSGLYVANDNFEIVSCVVDDSSVRYGKIGQYYVDIYASDGCNITHATIKVNIVDKIPPSLQFCYVDNRLVLDYKSDLEINFSTYFTAVDEYDGNVIQSLEILNFEGTDVGTYMLKAGVCDSSLNFIYYDFELVIVDTTPPTLELVGNSVEIDIRNIKSIDLLKYILKAEDNYSILTKADVKIVGEVKNQVGEYIVEYSLQDKSFNLSKRLLSIFVLSYSGPSITIINPIIQLGNNIELLDYVSVEDETDPNAKYTVKILETNLNIYEEGVYYATISASNSSGLFSYKTMLVTVKKNKEKSDISFYGIMIFICIGVIGAVGIIYYYKKSRRKP